MMRFFYCELIFILHPVNHPSPLPCTLVAVASAFADMVSSYQFTFSLCILLLFFSLDISTDMRAMLVGRAVM
jgi:hypothetical protein